MCPHATALGPLELKSAIVRDPLVVSPDTTVLAGITQMSGMRSLCNATRTTDDQLANLHLEARSSCVIAVENDQVVGILTERDVVRLSAQQQPLNSLTIRQVMARPLVTLRESAFTDLFAALSLLQQHHIRHLPILDEQDQLVGMITHESLRQTFRPIDLLRLRQVAEVMTREVVCATPNTAMLAIAQQMANHPVSSILIVEPGGDPTHPLQIPVGILTERDLVQFQAVGLNLETCTAQTVMSTPIFAIKPEDSLWTVQQIMNQRFIRRLGVIGEQGELLGIVTQTSLLGVLNPLELYKLAEALEAKVVSLEAERMALLESRNQELEQQVEARTAALKAKAEREKLVADLATQIRSSLSLQTILETTVQQLQQVIQCDRATIWQLEADGQVIAVAEFTRLSSSLLGERINDSCFQEHYHKVYSQGHIRVVPDIYTTEMADCHRELLIRLQTRAKILVPLLCGEQLWGLLCVSESQHPRYWTTEEVELLQALSVQLAIALQQATTYQQLHEELIARQQAELALQQSEAQSRAILNAIPDLMFRVGADGVYRGYVTQNRDFDLIAANIDPKGQRMVDVLPAELAERQLYYIQQALQTGKLQVYEQKLQVRSRLQDEEVRVIKSGDDEVLFMIRDISDRKQAEDALRKTEKQFREAQRIAHLGNWEFNLLKNTLYWSDEAFRIFEVNPKQSTACYADFINLIHPEDRNRVEDTYAQHLRDRTPYNLVHRLQMPDGRIKYVHEQCETLYAEDGTPLISQGTIQDITPLKQTELELERLNAELEAKVAERTQELWQVSNLQRAILDSTDYAIISTDLTGIIQTFNAGAERMLGYKAAEVVGKATPQIFCDSQEIVNRAASLSAELGQEIPIGFEVIVAKARQGIVNEEEWTNIRKDGSRIPISISVTALKDEHQQIIGFVGIGKDISDRQAALRERQQAELERQKLLQELSAFKLALDQAAIVAITDSKGVITYVNDRFCEISGYSREELIGHTHCMVNSSYHPPSFFKNLWHTLSKGEIWRGEICNRAKNGSLYWVESTLVPFLDAQGQPFQYLAIRFDITDRKLAEVKIQQENAFRQQIVENMAEGLCVYYEIEQFPWIGFTVWNQQMQVITGYSLEEINHLGWYQTLYPNAETQTQAIATLSPIKPGKTLITEEQEIQRKDGQKRTISISGSSLLNNDGKTYTLALIQDITERKQAEKALQESQQFLQTVLDTLPISVFWKNRESVFLGCNQQFAKALGLKSATEIIGKTDFDLLPLEANSYRADDRWVIESGQAKLGIEETLTRFNRELKWLETNKAPLYDWAGNVVGVVGTSQDITERKRVEVALKRQLAAIEAAIDGIAILQGETYLFVNHAHLELFGYEQPEELVGKSWKLLYPLAEIERFEQEVFPALERDRAWQGEAIATRKDGSTFNEGLSLTLTEEGLLICVCRDISDRKQAEIALQASETRFRQVFTANVVGIMFTDFSGQIVDANDRFLAMIGYTREDLNAGRINWSELTPLEHTAKDYQVIEHLQRYRAIEPWEKEYYRQDGSRVSVLVGVALLSETGNDCVCVVVDISDRKQAEIQLQQTNAELIRATRLKDEFLANMSHELRTPLNAILGMTEGLQDQVYGSINEQQLKALQTVERSGSHLLELINDILDVAKIESGQMKLNFASTEITKICQSSLSFIKQQALNKEIQLEVKSPPRLPTIWADERRIRQVLINLLNNAVKFTPNGGRITLEVSYFSSSNSLHLAITDTGIGIAPENLNKLFQPFIQIDSALNRQYEGTGLGLALVKQIVELHGGQVGVSSQVGVGSCFTISLPCSDSASSLSELTLINREETPFMELKLPASPLILLAEDNEANILTISSYLEAKGYRLIVANNGQEAIALAESANPDLILMDIQMPEMDGLTAIQQLRLHPNLVQVPIIALTALAMSGDRERCLAAGANDYLTKPVRLKELAATIQQLLESQ